MSVYLITGGARGLGAEIAMRLREAGHSILLADREKANLPGVRSVLCDLSDAAQIASLLNGLEAVEGKLDGLVCHTGPEAEAGSANLSSSAQLIHAAAGMLRAANGTAIAIHSESGEALPAMTRALARSLGPKVRVNCISQNQPEPDEDIAALAHDLLRSGAVLPSGDEYFAQRRRPMGE